MVEFKFDGASTDRVTEDQRSSSEQDPWDRSPSEQALWDPGS
jgi:hypothetical protein